MSIYIYLEGLGPPSFVLCIPPPLPPRRMGEQEEKGWPPTLPAGQDFDLVILDWHMPKMDGLEVLREMRRRSAANPGAPVPFVVILTADALTDCAQPFLDLGANLFMSKPINVPRLREALEQAALAQQ